MRRGRRPGGVKLVESLTGSELAKRRLNLILQTLAGDIGIPEACEELGIGEAMFHKMRSAYLEDSVGLLEPKAPGRKPHMESEEEKRIRVLEAEREDLKNQLFAAQIREELAQTMPGVLKEAKPGKKKGRRKNKRS